MKLILVLFVGLVSLRAWAFNQDSIENKALKLSASLYSMNINANSNSASFSITKTKCQGEDGTQTCVLRVSVKEKNPEAGVTSYVATFKNEQLVNIQQNCNYCW